MQYIFLVATANYTYSWIILPVVVTLVHPSSRSPNPIATVATATDFQVIATDS